MIKNIWYWTFHKQGILWKDWLKDNVCFDYWGNLMVLVLKVFNKAKQSNHELSEKLVYRFWLEFVINSHSLLWEHTILTVL